MKSRHRAPWRRVFAFLWVAQLGLAATALAQVHPAVPAFNSGAANAPYTLYLDFAGFSFNGTWGAGGPSPGVTPAYTVDGNASSFNTTELANIKNVWSRVAEKYSPFNINVTTVDPAPAAFLGNDTFRQAYYDSRPGLMHTVIGGSGSWRPDAGGVSYVNVAPGLGGAGTHTNWVFSAQAPSFLQFIGEASAHEDGHALGLSHQSDYSGNTLLAEYSDGTGVGPGSVAPIMGVSYYSERGLWKNGTAHTNESGPTFQNDPSILKNDPGMGGFINDGIGHTPASATPLPLTGSLVDWALAKGVIVPKSAGTPSSFGPNNYLTDYWSFTTGAGMVSLNLVSGRSTISPGLPDPGAMLDGTLTILDALGNAVATSQNGSLYESLTLSLAAGNYYARVQSAGDPDNLGLFDMGSYFLTGSIVAVPEPSTLVLLAISIAALTIGARRRCGAR
jgi:hypothetical protein